jgi:hypothetical protein
MFYLFIRCTRIPFTLLLKSDEKYHQGPVLNLTIALTTVFIGIRRAVFIGNPNGPLISRFIDKRGLLVDRMTEEV